MSRIRLKNNTDDTIVIEPGESVDVHGEESTLRVMASRVKTLCVETVNRK